MATKSLVKTAGIGLAVAGLLLATSFTASASANVTLFFSGTSIAGGFVAGQNNSMATDGQGNLFIVGTVAGAGAIVEVSVSDPSVSSVFATSANMNNADPKTLTIDSTGDIFVYASDSHIYKFPAGSPSNTNAIDYAVGVSSVMFIAAIGANLYFSNFFDGTVYSVPVGLTTGLPTSSLSTFATGLAAPGAQGIAADGNYLLVADDANFNGGSLSGVYRLDTLAGPYTNPALWVDTSSDSTFIPVDVAADSSGNVFVGDYSNRLLSIPTGSSTPSEYLNPVTDAGQGGIWGLCLVGSQFFMSGVDSASGNNQAIFQISTYDGSANAVTTTSTLAPPTTTTTLEATTTTTSEVTTTTSATTTTTTGSGALAHTGFNARSILVASGLFVASGIVLTQEVARARRRARR